MKKEVSRRFVVGALGAGAAAAAAGSAVRVVGERSATASKAAEPDHAVDQVAAELFAPLVAGSPLGSWTVERITNVEHGAASVVLHDAAGVRFQLDVCSRDISEGARQSPGTTEHFQVFLANHGDGNTSTHEEHGLAAMALADVIRTNEHRVERTGFQTLARRLSTDAARVHVT